MMQQTRYALRFALQNTRAYGAVDKTAHTHHFVSLSAHSLVRCRSGLAGNR